MFRQVRRSQEAEPYRRCSTFGNRDTDTASGRGCVYLFCLRFSIPFRDRKMASGESAAIDECAEKRRRLYNAYKDTKNEPIPFKKSDYNLFFAIRSSRTDNVRFSIRAAKPVYGLVLRRTARLEEYVRLKSASAASYTQEKSVRYVLTILPPRQRSNRFEWIVRTAVNDSGRIG